MSFGLARGKRLDPAPGRVLIAAEELGPLPDGILTDPAAGWQDPRGWFPNADRALHLEIGPGKGAFLVEQAGLGPEDNYLGIEWAHEFCIYAADRVRRARQASGDTTHHNIRLLNHDATDFVRWRVPTASVGVIHLYFSDPWPKPRHHKKRVIQDRFLADAWRVLAPGGELRVVTDHDALWAWDQEHFDRWTTPGAAGLLAQHLGDRLLATAPDRPRAGSGEPPFIRRPFEPPAGARDGEIVGTNFERKFRPVKEAAGSPFHAATLVRRP